MCLAIPVQILELTHDERALVELDGIEIDVSVELIESPRVGDYVIVHVGYALEKLDPDEARQTLDLMRGRN